MEKFFSFFMINRELADSPAIQVYKSLHDVKLIVGSRETVSLLLPSYVYSHVTNNIRITYNPSLIELENAVITEKRGEFRLYTHVDITVTARDIGSTTIGFASEKTIPSKTQKEFSTVSLETEESTYQIR